MFYTDKRDHTSPSALSKFIEDRPGFERTYFAEEKTFVNAAMKNGTDIHKKIEQGLVNVKCRYEFAERNGGELKVPFKVGRLKLEAWAILDSWEQKKDHAVFVDYKTGSPWTKERSEGDLKQAFNAWILWKHTGLSDIRGAIEWVDGDDPNAKTKVYPVRYTEERLLEIDELVQKTVRDINAAFEDFESRTEAFLEEDTLQRYAELKAQKKIIEDEMAGLTEKITGQMDAGGLRNAKTAYGTFYFTERAVYEYPPAIVKAELKLKADKKAFTDTHEPVSTTRSLGFK